MIDRHVFTTVRLPVRLKWIVLGWLVAECLIFAFLVRTIGFGATILLGLGTTVLGLVTLRRLGTEALVSLRGAVEGRRPADGALLDGMLGGLGALLLIIPGFLANLAGLALAAPSVRRKATALFGADAMLAGGRPRRSGADVVDLGPADWRAIDGP
jgi:UPF0716 protein FxsA